MNKCDYCGEYKKVRKKYSNYYLGDTPRKHEEKSIFGIGSSCNISYDYICEDCDKALKIEHKQFLIKQESREKEIQKEWIKERNKLLKEKNKR
jgi:hypothetical protein